MKVYITRKNDDIISLYRGEFFPTHQETSDEASKSLKRIHHAATKMPVQYYIILLLMTTGMAELFSVRWNYVSAHLSNGGIFHWLWFNSNSFVITNASRVLLSVGQMTVDQSYCIMFPIFRIWWNFYIKNQFNKETAELSQQRWKKSDLPWICKAHLTANNYAERQLDGNAKWTWEQTFPRPRLKKSTLALHIQSVIIGLLVRSLGANIWTLW